MTTATLDKPKANTMQFTANRQAMQSALSIAGRAIPSKATAEVNKCVSVHVQSGRCTLRTTDNEVFVETWIECDVTQQVQFLVPHAMLAKAMAESGGESVTFEFNNENVIVKSQDSEFKIGCVIGEMPQASPIVDGPRCTLHGSELSGSLKRCLPFIGEASNYALNGVHFYRDKTLLKLAATDTRALATEAIPAAWGSEVTMKHTLPEKACKAILAALETDCECTLLANDSMCMLESGPTKTMARMAAGAFPPVEKIMPTSFNHETVIAAKDIAICLRRSAFVRSEETMGIKVVFSAGLMTCRGEGMQNTSRVEMPIGCDFDLATEINPDLIVQGLNALGDGESVTLKLIDNGSVLVFDHSHGKFLIMPIVR